MTHHHLRFQIADGIQRDTNHNENRGAAQRNIDSAEVSDQNRKDRDDTQEQSAHQGNARENLGNEIRSRFSGTDSRNRTAVFPQIVRHLNRVKLDGSIEVSKPDDQNEINDRIEKTACAERF